MDGVARGFERRNEAFVKEVFARHADAAVPAAGAAAAGSHGGGGSAKASSGTRTIAMDKVPQALADVHARIRALDALTQVRVVLCCRRPSPPCISNFSSVLVAHARTQT